MYNSQPPPSYSTVVLPADDIPLSEFPHGHSQQRGIPPNSTLATSTHGRYTFPVPYYKSAQPHTFLIQDPEPIRNRDGFIEIVVTPQTEEKNPAQVCCAVIFIVVLIMFIVLGGVLRDQNKRRGY